MNFNNLSNIHVCTFYLVLYRDPATCKKQKFSGQTRRLLISQVMSTIYYNKIHLSWVKTGNSAVLGEVYRFLMGVSVETTRGLFYIITL